MPMNEHATSRAETNGTGRKESWPI
jgi:hypothetical protein